MDDGTNLSLWGFVPAKPAKKRTHELEVEGKEEEEGSKTNPCCR